MIPAPERSAEMAEAEANGEGVDSYATLDDAEPLLGAIPTSRSRTWRLDPSICHPPGRSSRSAQSSPSIKPNSRTVTPAVASLKCSQLTILTSSSPSSSSRKSSRSAPPVEENGTGNGAGRPASCSPVAPAIATMTARTRVSRQH